MDQSSPANQSRNLKARSIALALFIGLVFLWLAAHLFTLQVVKGLEYQRQAKAVTRRSLPIPAQRGEIFDRHHDLPLVVNQDSFAVDVIPGELTREQMHEVFAKLSDLLSVPVEEIEKRVPPRYYHLFQPIEIKGGVDFETIAWLAEHLQDFPGVSWHNKPVRSYLEGADTAHVIGYVGDITRDELQVLYNQGYGYGSVLGKSGLEKQYDRVLRGQDGRRYRMVDVQERNIGQKPEEDVAPVPGKDLVLTLDRNIQRLAAQALGPRIGSVVVLKPTTGEILALVSYPAYDANLFYTDQSSEEFRRLSLDPASPFLNRAIQSAYPPASTFKVIMSTAVAEEEILPLTKTIRCTGEFPYGDRVFRDHVKSGHGAVNLFSGLAESCDIYFYTVGDMLGVERITFYSREFGLGSPTGIDIPGEVPGFVPSPEWKERVQHVKWVGGDTINMSIGQGFLTATPLQMANAIAMVANEGVNYRPYLVKEIRDPISGAVLSESEPEILHTSHVSPETWRAVQQAMRQVITQGTANVVITTKAVEVAGKTGTAEMGLQEQWHSWFGAYAPYETDDPEERVVVLVMVEGRNDWEWWAPKAADVIFQGIFAHQSYQEAVETLRPWWYIQQQMEERARRRAEEARARGEILPRPAAPTQAAAPAPRQQVSAPAAPAPAPAPAPMPERPPAPAAESGPAASPAPELPPAPGPASAQGPEIAPETETAPGPTLGTAPGPAAEAEAWPEETVP